MGTHKHHLYDGTVKTKPVIIGEGFENGTQGIQEWVSCIVGDNASSQLRTTIYGILFLFGDNMNGSGFLISLGMLCF